MMAFSRHFARICSPARVRMLVPLDAVLDAVPERDGRGSRREAGQSPLLHAVLHLGPLGLLPDHRPVDLLAVGTPDEVGGLGHQLIEALAVKSVAAVHEGAGSTTNGVEVIVAICSRGTFQLQNSANEPVPKGDERDE